MTCNHNLKKCAECGDTLVLLGRTAQEQYELGMIDKQTLVEILQALINERAKENGYADAFGLPFPEDP